MDAQLLPPRPPGDVAITVVGATREGDNLVVEVIMAVPVLAVKREPPPVDAWSPEPHTIIIPLAAIENRQRGYGLATPAEAFRAILREHAKRLCEMPDGDESPNPRSNLHGGLRRDVVPAVPPAVDRLLDGLV